MLACSGTTAIQSGAGMQWHHSDTEWYMLACSGTTAIQSGGGMQWHHSDTEWWWNVVVPQRYRVVLACSGTTAIQSGGGMQAENYPKQHRHNKQHHACMHHIIIEITVS